MKQHGEFYFGKRNMVYVLLMMAAWTAAVFSQESRPFDMGAAGMYQTLLRLQTTGSILHVVAHPDDEDGPLLAYSARGLGVRTLLFSITRGEGGANLIAPYFFDELGALRTLEHVKSASYYGNELFYSRAADYGFSKSLDEARRQWKNGEPILADLVEVVRREQPMVIASRFRGDRRDGHGHHQMAGVLSGQVMEAAADPNRFSEQLARGLRPWRVQKLYVNNIRPERRSEDRNAWTVAVPTGDYNLLLGRSYAQIARFGLGFQRSQGISGHIGTAGPQESYYRLARTAVSIETPQHEDSMFAGIDTTIPGLASLAGNHPPRWLEKGLNDIHNAVQAAVSAYDVHTFDAIVPSLSQGLNLTRELLSQLDGSDMDEDARHSIGRQLVRKQHEFQEALRIALGLDFQAWAIEQGQPAQSSIFGRSSSGFNHATPGQTFVIKARLVNRSQIPVEVQELWVETPIDWSTEALNTKQEPLQFNGVAEASAVVRVSRDAQITRPDWQRESVREPFYDISNERWQQLPLPRSPSQCVAKLSVAGTELVLRRTVEVRVRHPEFGRVRFPLTVVPAISVRFPSRHGIVPLTQNRYDAEIVVRSGVKGPARGQIRLDLPPGWTSEPKSRPFDFSREDEEATFQFCVTLPKGLAARQYVLRAVAEHEGREYTSGYRTITARDLGRLNLYRDAVHELQTVDVKLLGNPQIGYIMGSGDEIPLALGMLGLRPFMLAGQELAAGDLSRFDVIIIGVRAYAVRPDVVKFNGRLLDYVKKGGTLIVQYQTPEFDKNFGPYPYSMGRRPEEVSEEDAPVSILAPENPIFHQPNEITSADFDGWLEQRGSKFWDIWDPRYTALLESHDTGQAPQQGGMLLARYGEGIYLYSAYAWYRQLPHGVPGAFRIYANMLSLPVTMKDGR